ncbi:MAG TPA: RodZ domain-containing protein [Actinomycetota bacterium]|nr:RodZ domain-containing protein [Actinomycetota bacterium]
MTTQTIGRTLRVERERKRLSLETISRATMVRADYLQLIDDDRLEQLPSGAYAKGFIRAYANYLGMDPQPFMREYDETFSGGPELSAVARGPVRVPQPAHPRAWRNAAATAAAALVILGLVGGFRSLDEPANPPGESLRPASAQRATVPSPAASVLGAVVRVEVTDGETWVTAAADGEQLFDQLMVQGERKTFHAEEAVDLVVGNPEAVKLYANGVELDPPLQDVYKATFTPDTTSLPPSQAL